MQLLRSVIPTMMFLLLSACYGGGPGSKNNAAGVDIEINANDPMKTSADIDVRTLAWKGEWLGSATYVKHDAVSFNGGAYALVADSVSAVDPTTSLYWDALVSPGNGTTIAAARPHNADILVLASGQSNMSQHHDFEWNPPHNLSVWNNHLIHPGIGSTDETVGTHFEPWPEDKINTAAAYAAFLAEQNPDITVRLILIAWGALHIEHWIDDTRSPDMYKMVTRNVDAALQQLPAGTTVDHFLWWQGESNEGEGYFEKYTGFEKALRSGHAWFSNHTRTVLYGLNSPANGGYSRFGDVNQELFELADGNPRQTVHIQTGVYDFPDGIHIAPKDLPALGAWTYANLERLRQQN